MDFNANFWIAIAAAGPVIVLGDIVFLDAAARAARRMLDPERMSSTFEFLTLMVKGLGGFMAICLAAASTIKALGSLRRQRDIMSQHTASLMLYYALQLTVFIALFDLVANLVRGLIILKRDAQPQDLAEGGNE